MRKNPVGLDLRAEFILRKKRTAWKSDIARREVLENRNKKKERGGGIAKAEEKGEATRRERRKAQYLQGETGSILGERRMTDPSIEGRDVVSAAARKGNRGGTKMKMGRHIKGDRSRIRSNEKEGEEKRLRRRKSAEIKREGKNFKTTEQERSDSQRPSYRGSSHVKPGIERKMLSEGSQQYVEKRRIGKEERSVCTHDRTLRRVPGRNREMKEPSHPVRNRKAARG